MELRNVPHSDEAEKGVLGSVLLDPSSLDRVTVDADSFYDRRHQVLFASMVEMSQSGKPMDALTIGDWLKGRGEIDTVGGYDYLVELQDSALVAAHIEHYSGIVEAKKKLRTELEILGNAIEKVHSGESSADDVMGSLAALHRQEAHGIDEIKESWSEAKEGRIKSMPTPFPDFDLHTGGVRLGMPAVLTGRSGGGKSMFLSQWYNHLGQNNFPVLVFPFEDEYDVTITRMAANLGKYKWRKIENGGEWKFFGGKREWLPVTDKEIALASRCLDEVSKYPVHFHEGSIKPSQLSQIVATYKRKHGIKGVFIDGAKDFLKPSGKYNDVGFDEETSQAIKNTCKKHKVAGVVVHHLTKIPEGELISLNNIRGSGNIISDSRIVYALQSDGVGEQNFDDTGKMTTRRFDCLKNNHGGVATMRLECDLDKCVFWKEN